MSFCDNFRWLSGTREVENVLAELDAEKFRDTRERKTGTGVGFADVLRGLVTRETRDPEPGSGTP